MKWRPFKYLYKKQITDVLNLIDTSVIRKILQLGILVLMHMEI